MRDVHLPFVTKVVGVSFRADNVNAARVGDTVTCVAEPSNPYDPNAVAVYTPAGHVGYLAAPVAVRVGAQLRPGSRLVGVVAEHHRGDTRRNPSMTIRVERLEASTVGDSGPPVAALSGRPLGTLVRMDADVALIDTGAGGARYPAHLVEVAPS